MFLGGRQGSLCLPGQWHVRQPSPLQLRLEQNGRSEWGGKRMADYVVSDGEIAQFIGTVNNQSSFAELKGCLDSP